MLTIDPASVKPDGLGYCTMRLAMSQSIDEENNQKKMLTAMGLRVVVTEVGGNTKRDFLEKSSRAVFGAAMNAGLIQRDPRELHALLHALEEARQGIIINTSSEANLAVKVAIVRMEHWIAVAIFGESAIHPMTGHERCGLGIMHM